MPDQKDNHRPYYLASTDGGRDRRAMVSLGPIGNNSYCHFNCQFCYVHGPFPKYDRAKPEEIVAWLKANTGNYDIVYVSGDTDSFAFNRAPEAIRLLRLIAENINELDCDVLFTTRYVFSGAENQELADISRLIRRQGKLLIGCVSVCQLSFPALEPSPLPTPYERIDQLGDWKHLGLCTVLAIRPFIPSVPASELVELATHGIRYADVIIGGHLYMDNDGNIEEKLKAALPAYTLEGHPVHNAPLDFTHANDVWQEVQHLEAEVDVRKVCERLGKPFEMRSQPAVEHIRKNRQYFVGSNNQRMFVANILASIAMQMLIIEINGVDASSYRNEQAKAFRQFIQPYLKPTDMPVNSWPKSESKADPGFAVIDDGSETFQGVFKMLQEELQTLLLNSFGEDEILANSTVRNILYGSLEDIGDLFGSIPHGWDTLVKMKRELLGRNKIRSMRSKWFTKVLADVEKVIRDLVCTSILNMGANKIFHKAILETNKKFQVTDCDLRDPTLLPQISIDFSNYMANDATQTFSLGRYFFDNLQPDKSSSEIIASQRMDESLGDLGEDREQILNCLLEIRQESLHDPVVHDFFPHKNFLHDSKLDQLTEWPDERCSEIVQFLGSICVESSLCCLGAILSDPDSKSLEAAPLYKMKANSEFRVHNLLLLEDELYWLAYFFAQASDYFLEDGKSIMLKLNAAYAYQNIASKSGGHLKFPETEVPSPNANQRWNSKHHLIRNSILKKTEGLRELMFLAAEEMSPEEFRNWPALSYLRSTAEFKQVLEKIEDILTTK